MQSMVSGPARTQPPSTPARPNCMSRRCASALGFVAVLLLSGCGNPVGHDVAGTATVTGDDTGGSVAAIPDEVRVECSPRGISLSTVAMNTQRAGAVLVVSSSMPPGTYLGYGSDGNGSFAGGDRLPRRATRWTLPLAPGTVTLTCEPGGQAGPEQTATLRLSDPEGFWRGESLAALGCGTPVGQPSWVVGPGESRRNAEEAVRRLLDAFETLSTSQGHPAGYTARPARTGYPAAKTQTWVGAENGRARVSIDVTQTRRGYTAVPDLLCH